MSFLARKPTDVWDRIAIPISIASKNFCEVLFASLDFWNPDAYQWTDTVLAAKLLYMKFHLVWHKTKVTEHLIKILFTTLTRLAC